MVLAGRRYHGDRERSAGRCASTGSSSALIRDPELREAYMTVPERAAIVELCENWGVV